jgi:hypothetical protein
MAPPSLAAPPSPEAVAAGARSLERRAADAVALGAYGDAAVLYDRLAELAEGAKGDASLFREAARIARRKQRRQP